MTTSLGERIDTGDVIEFMHEGQTMSALVLLATAEALILDTCDGATPFVVRPDEFESYRVFQGA